MELGSIRRFKVVLIALKSCERSAKQRSIFSFLYVSLSQLGFDIFRFAEPLLKRRSNWWTQVRLRSMWVQGVLTWLQLDQVGLRRRLHLVWNRGGSTKSAVDCNGLQQTPRRSNAAPNESGALLKSTAVGFESTILPDSMWS